MLKYFFFITHQQYMPPPPLPTLQSRRFVLPLQHSAKPPRDPLRLSAPLLIILLFVFSFLLNVLFILFRVSPGTLQN